MSDGVDVTTVPRALRYIAGAIGVLLFVLGVGFGLNMEWATVTWPWPDGRLSHLFIGSILGAASTAFIWIGMSGEWGALPAGTLSLLVMSAGMSGYLFQLSQQPGKQDLAWYAAFFSLVALINTFFFFWSRRYSLRDMRQTPIPLRISYGAFVITLVLAASALILQLPVIFPWPLNPDSSVMFGWVFAGDAAYFLYSLLNPRWHNARGQLLSFLAYDLFLIVPFLGLFATVKLEHMLSLVLYVAVLIYSGLLAVYYLFLNRQTRGWAVEETAS